MTEVTSIEGTFWIRCARILAGFALVCALLLRPAATAHAKLFDIQTQLRYDYQEVKDRGESPVGDGNLVLTGNLALRRPILPGSSFLTNLGFNSSETAEQLGRQSNRNLELSIIRNQSRYTFSGRAARREFANTSTVTAGSSTGYSNDYSATLLLREPAWPVFNIQYQGNTTGSSYAGSDTSRTTSTLLMSGYYDMAPLRFSYDRVRQAHSSPGAPGSGTLSQRSSVLLNHEIMQGLAVTGELSRSSTESETGGNAYSSNSSRQLVRLSMTPTRAVTAGLGYSRQSSASDRTAGSMRNSSDTMFFNVRSQVMPGLAVGYAEQHQSQSSGPTDGSAYGSRSMGLNAQLSPTTFVNGSLSHAEYGDSPTTPGSKQDSLQFALQTDLTPRTDLSLAYSRNQSKVASDEAYTGTSAGISLRDRSSDKLSTGISFRWSESNQLLQGGESTTQSSTSLDLDALWLPTHDLGINFRLNCMANNGSSISQTIDPAFDLRWGIDSSTNLSVNYRFRDTDQWDWASASIIGQRTSSLSLRLAHNFIDGSSLDLAYDFFGDNLGQREWEKRFRAYFATRL